MLKKLVILFTVLAFAKVAFASGEEAKKPADAEHHKEVHHKHKEDEKHHKHEMHKKAQEKHEDMKEKKEEMMKDKKEEEKK